RRASVAGWDGALSCDWCHRDVRIVSLPMRGSRHRGRPTKNGRPMTALVPLAWRVRTNDCGLNNGFFAYLHIAVRGSSMTSRPEADRQLVDRTRTAPRRIGAKLELHLQGVGIGPVHDGNKLVGSA